jgi:hypothetical protein
MKTWRECYFERRQLKSDKWDHYFEIYDRYFERRRCKAAPVYLEIGCQNGGSLETARCYFGDQAKIFGIDNEPSCAALNEMPFVSRVFIGDQSDPTFLNSVATETGPLDIVLDDGSHQAHDQIVSFLTLFPALATDGVYLIEDTAAAFYPLQRKLFYGLSVFDYFKGFSERLSADSARGEFIDNRYLMPREQRQGDERQKQGMLREIWSITFFDSVIAIEKAAPAPEPLRHQR